MKPPEESACSGLTRSTAAGAWLLFRKRWFETALDCNCALTHTSFPKQKDLTAIFGITASPSTAAHHPDEERRSTLWFLGAEQAGVPAAHAWGVHTNPIQDDLGAGSGVCGVRVSSRATCF